MGGDPARLLAAQFHATVVGRSARPVPAFLDVLPGAGNQRRDRADYRDVIATHPTRALLGFAVALAIVFATSFLLGRSLGPVAPDLRPGPRQSPADGGMPGMTMQGPHR